MLIPPRAARTDTLLPYTTGVRSGGQMAGRHAVMIGTAHFVNAVVQRRDLIRVAALRICLPASQSLEPMVDWPQDLRATVDPMVFMVEGDRKSTRLNSSH